MDAEDIDHIYEDMRCSKEHKEIEGELEVEDRSRNERSHERITNILDTFTKERACS